MAIIVDGGELLVSLQVSKADIAVDACLKATRKLMMSGVDHVKICTSGGVLSPTDKLTGSQFTIPEIKAVCDTVRMMVSQR
jgi:imidazolonepropionase-like amidohydrolase